MKRKVIATILLLACPVILGSCKYISDKITVTPETSESAVTEQTMPFQTERETDVQGNTSGEQKTIYETVRMYKEQNVSRGIKYDQLTQNEKDAYDQICTGLSKHDDDIEISIEIDRDSLCRIYEAILTTEEKSMYDPMRRYSCSYIEDTGKITKVVPVYSYSEEEGENIKAEVEAAADKVINMIDYQMTDVDKIRLFHDYIIKNCTYYSDILNYSDEEIENIMDESNYDNAYGVLVEKKAVCEGYARAFRYLCQKSGIACELISGSGSGEQHMWNVVCVDNQWYHIDLTWDDPLTNSNYAYNNISYNYFNVNDEEINKDHIIDETFFKYPECTSDEANYFKYYDMVASDTEKAAEILKREIINLNGEEGVLYIKAVSYNTYKQIIAYLFDHNQEGISRIFIEANKQLGISETDRSFIRSTDEERHIIKLVI